MNELLTGLEIDTIGEILNISMGAAATAVSTLLDRQVNITTPHVSIVKTEEFECVELEPAEGIEIEYIEGLHGSNFMIMRRRDIRAIVDLLISGEGNVDSDEPLDEMHVSAVSEIMNQMMGSSSTALASFFGKNINISTPKRFDFAHIQERINIHGVQEFIVTVSFNLTVEGLINSEFITVFPIGFTKELVKNALQFGDNTAETKQPSAPTSATSAQAVPKTASRPAETEYAQSNANYETRMSGYNQTPKPVMAEQMRSPAPPQREAQQVSVKPLKFKSFDEEQILQDEENQTNFSLILGVPLEITVEIGRTRKQVKEIIEFRSGTIIELDKQAGDPVDVIVNGQLMARGDVVVIDDNFGVRITEIVPNKEILKQI